MTVTGLNLIRCDFDGCDEVLGKEVNRNGPAQNEVVAMREHAGRWKWRVDDEDRDICPKHPTS